MQQVTMPRVTRVAKLDPVMLFRYSALIYNGHRIHYDYPRSQIASLSFRALRPIFDTNPFTLGLTETDTGTDLVAIDVQGALAMQARVDVG